MATGSEVAGPQICVTCVPYGTANGVPEDTIHSFKSRFPNRAMPAMLVTLTNHTSAEPSSNRKNARLLGKPACSAMGGQAGLVMKGTAYYHLLRLLYLLRKVLTEFIWFLAGLCGISGYFQSAAAKL